MKMSSEQLVTTVDNVDKVKSKKYTFKKLSHGNISDISVCVSDRVSKLSSDTRVSELSEVSRPGISITMQDATY